MSPLFILLVCLAGLGSLAEAYDSQGHCVWYDVCGKDPNPPNAYNAHCLNCAYDGPAKQLAPEFEKILDEACPHIRKDLGDDLRLCCSPAQLNDLLNNFNMAKVFLERCPTCFYNFRKNFCDMTCRPDQSLFLKPEIIEGNKTDCKQTLLAPGRASGKHF